MSTAKEEILAKIRRSTRGGDCAADYSGIGREYLQAGTLDMAGRLDLLADRLHDYNAKVYRSAEAGLADAIAAALEARGKRRIVIPADIPEAWLPRDFDFIRGEGLDYAELDGIDGVLTGCAVAAAFTGTIVLRHGPGEAGRALTLIPDYHLCVVFAEQVVETIPEAIRAMAGGGAPLTTVSGPSATSDIEMTRVKGVHGPRTLDVILTWRFA